MADARGLSIRMSVLQQDVCQAIPSGGTRADSHQRKAVRVQVLRHGIPTSGVLQQTPIDPRATRARLQV